MTDDTSLSFYLPSVGRKKLTCAFGGGRLTPGRGGLLLGSIERRPGIAEALARPIDHPRNPLSMPLKFSPVVPTEQFSCA
jgi:hypothetical protein